MSSEQSYLGRALGINPQLEIDYRTLRLEEGDVFLLATDGVYEHVERALRRRARSASTPAISTRAAQRDRRGGLPRGSEDNLTVQIVRIDDAAGRASAGEASAQASELPLPPLLEPRMMFDGYRIVRETARQQPQPHLSRRRHRDRRRRSCSRLPSIDLRDDAAYLERFLMEEWVARRIDSPHVLKPLRAAASAQLPLCRRPNSSTGRR